MPLKIPAVTAEDVWEYTIARANVMRTINWTPKYFTQL